MILPVAGSFQHEKLANVCGFKGDDSAAASVFLLSALGARQGVVYIERGQPDPSTLVHRLHVWRSVGEGREQILVVCSCSDLLNRRPW
jgi:hypothetical protein